MEKETFSHLFGETEDKVTILQRVKSSICLYCHGIEWPIYEVQINKQQQQQKIQIKRK